MYLNPETREVVDLPETLVIELNPPLEYGAGTWTSLTLREPTLGQCAAAHAKYDDAYVPSSSAERECQLTLIALVTNKPAKAIDGLRASVIRRAYEYLHAFVIAKLDSEPPAPDEPELIIDLDTPLKGAGDVNQVTLREPTGGELLEAERLLGKGQPPLPGPVRRYQQRLIEKGSGLPAQVVAQIPIRKAREAVRFLEGFERSAPATMKSSAQA